MTAYDPPTASAFDPDEARSSYDVLASTYDRFTAGYGHHRWLARIEQLAVLHGLSGRRLLDLGCGTGKSFLPLRERGYCVTACDVSEEMLAVAARKAPDVSLYRADLRSLPVLGEFDLITALDDPLNYLLTERELRTALRGIASNMATAGVLIFDLNTLTQYRSQFARDAVLDDGDVLFAWCGDAHADAAANGGRIQATLEVFARADGDLWRRRTSVHTQRHWPRQAVDRAARAAGLELVAVLGQRAGAESAEELDELVHPKAIYVARKQKGATMDIGTLP